MFVLNNWCADTYGYRRDRLLAAGWLPGLAIGEGHGRGR